MNQWLDRGQLGIRDRALRDPAKGQAERGLKQELSGPGKALMLQEHQANSPEQCQMT